MVTGPEASNSAFFRLTSMPSEIAWNEWRHSSGAARKTSDASARSRDPGPPMSMPGIGPSATGSTSPTVASLRPSATDRARA